MRGKKPRPFDDSPDLDPLRTGLTLMEEVLVRARSSSVSLDAMLDFLRRRARIARLTRRDMVFLECADESESESDEELESELELSSHAAAGPGVDSSSIMC
jgi:hypothetical protein